MTTWFRFYEAALDDPKVQTLPGDDFKSWVNILCVACRNDGVLPALPSLAFMLRMSLHDCETLIERLSNAGLIDRKNGGANGSRYAPHGWDKRQYKSDSSSARVKRYRGRSAPVAETPPDTETEADTERGSEANASSASAPSSVVISLDPSRMLFGEGLNLLARISGKSAQALRSAVGRWVQLTGKDHTAILRLIQQAADQSIIDPVAWIEAALKPRDQDADIYRNVL